MNILITGGASGLGLAITRELAKNELNQIFFTYCHSEKMANDLQNECKNTRAIHCNFKEKKSVEDLVQTIAQLEIQCLINNAYVGPLKKEHFHQSHTAQTLLSFEHNVWPTLSITQACLKVFRKQKDGRIINILSSVVLGNPAIGWSEYYAEKMYLLAMNKSWAAENAAFEIVSNAISPSFMDTPIHGNLDERDIELIRNQHPLKKILSLEETAAVVLFLTQASKQMNGVNIPINAASKMI